MQSTTMKEEDDRGNPEKTSEVKEMVVVRGQEGLVLHPLRSGEMGGFDPDLGTSKLGSSPVNIWSEGAEPGTLG